MHVRGGEKGVDARVFGVLDGFPNPIDFGLDRRGQRRDDWPADFACDSLNRRELLVGRGREACLEHIDT